jgi:MFS family permease
VTPQKVQAEPAERAKPDAGKVRSITIIALAQVAALALWFSTTAVASDLAVREGLSSGKIAILALAVQLGFVAGGLGSAALGLADRIDPRRLFALGAVIGAGSNALFLVIDPGGPIAVVSRFFVGASLAAVYPVGMKMAAGWATKGDAGLLVGVLVGALTLGSAAPHGFAWAGGLDWRSGVMTASISAFTAAALIQLARLGPRHAAAQKFEPRAALDIVRDRGVRLATLGYLGHMWELYAGWTWIGALAAASFALRAPPAAAAHAAKAAAFAIVGAGAIGCVAAGWLADRIGRTTVTMAAMAISGASCLAFGLAYGASPVWIVAVGLVWGLAVVADSAQFSASIAELGRPERVGTLLTIQTATGFLLTAVSIRLLPVWVAATGWRWAFAPLAVGPLLGVAAMARLRASPEARRLAGGRG